MGHTRVRLGTLTSLHAFKAVNDAPCSDSAGADIVIEHICSCLLGELNTVCLFAIQFSRVWSRLGLGSPYMCLHARDRKSLALMCYGWATAILAKEPVASSSQLVYRRVPNSDSVLSCEHSAISFS